MRLRHCLSVCLLALSGAVVAATYPHTIEPSGENTSWSVYGPVGTAAERAHSGSTTTTLELVPGVYTISLSSGRVLRGETLIWEGSAPTYTGSRCEYEAGMCEIRQVTVELAQPLEVGVGASRVRWLGPIVVSASKAGWGGGGGFAQAKVVNSALQISASASGNSGAPWLSDAYFDVMPHLPAASVQATISASGDGSTRAPGEETDGTAAVLPEGVWLSRVLYVEELPPETLEIDSESGHRNATGSASVEWPGTGGYIGCSVGGGGGPSSCSNSAYFEGPPISVSLRVGTVFLLR